jgi:hypothetical protein
MNGAGVNEEQLWPGSFEGARIANLLAFARLTPEQKLQWLADMLEFIEVARRAGGGQESFGRTVEQSPTDAVCRAWEGGTATTGRQE